MKTALITGVTGQDGAYLAQLLLEKGYRVCGTFRKSVLTSFWRLDELMLRLNDNFTLLEYNPTGQDSAQKLIDTTEPNEIYNLAAQSIISVSMNNPVETSMINGLGVVWLLEAIRKTNSNIKFYQASTSEMFGDVGAVPQSEETPFYPRNPYGVSKLYAHWMVSNYRQNHGVFAASGILFNHESPLRGREFVTRKITSSIAKISAGEDHVLQLGNVNARRDWGFAKDYVEGMYLMLQTDNPGTFILATSRSHSVKDFVNCCCKYIDLELDWVGDGINEIAVNSENGKKIIEINPNYYRKSESSTLVGNPSKAQRELGWYPRTSFSELCELMIKTDISRYKNLHKN